MSPYTLVSDRAQLQPGIRISEEPQTVPSVSITLQPRRADDVWEQFSEAVKHGAAKLGFEQPDTDVREHQPMPRLAVDTVIVAPGVIVSASEYQERYGGIDLEALRRRMAPAVFKAFVRYIGSVRGREDLDVDAISGIPDE